MFHGNKAGRRDLPIRKELRMQEKKSWKLAELEGMADVREKMCDEYCQYPCKCPNQETLDNICSACELAKLFDVMTGEERI